MKPTGQKNAKKQGARRSRRREEGAVGGTPGPLLPFQRYAELHGISAESAVVMAAAVLRGIAGPDAMLVMGSTHRSLPKVDLLLRGVHGPGERALDELLEPARLINRQLARSFSGISRKALDAAQWGGLAGAVAARVVDGDETANAIGRAGVLLETGTGSSPNAGLSGSLMRDLEPAGTSIRREAVERPTFLIEGAGVRKLAGLLACCHRGHGLVVLRGFPDKDQRLRDASDSRTLRSLQEGMLDDPAPVAGLIGAPQAILAHALVLCGRDDYEQLARLAPHLLANVLVLEGGEGAKRRPASKADEVAGFLRKWRETVIRIVEERRGGVCSAVVVPDDQVAGSILQQHAEYQEECDKCPIEPGPAARGLPESVLWMLGCFAPETLEAGPKEAKALVGTVFGIARRMLAAHCNEVERLTRAARQDAEIRFLERIVSLVAETPGITLRELSRRFKDQSKERFLEPVARLEKLGLIKRDPSGLLRPGNRKLHEVVVELEELVSGEGQVGTPGSGAKKVVGRTKVRMKGQRGK